VTAIPASTVSETRETRRAPLLIGRPDDEELADLILTPLWTRSRAWWILFGLSGSLSLLFVGLIAYSVVTGVGVWGNNVPVAWGFPIINFVWWIGIGHAGTFISAFLLLMGQHWRASVNRLAEAMTLFALVNASIFPLLHLGRPWFFYWLVPYPSTLGVWPQFKSTLPWDVAAITAYFIVSLLFWYLGLLPDLAAARDRAPGTVRKRIYGVFALGWRGAGRQWHYFRVAYLLLAGLATPLVISVHSIVSLDFAIAQLPGWHSTIFPPYFVVGAVFSGLAMVLVLMLPVRRIFGLESLITERHLDNIAKLLLGLGLAIAYSYLVEAFMAWYSANEYERRVYLVDRTLGPYAWAYWTMTAINVLVPHLFWSRRLRRSVPVLFGAGLLILLGMWGERFIIIVTSLHRDFLPSSWHQYVPSLVDWGILLGSIGMFLFLFLAFLRWIPIVPLHEVKRLRHELTAASGAEEEA
jgi:Ni/Fe-hydrogenase subunit HybB-like protein